MANYLFGALLTIFISSSVYLPQIVGPNPGADSHVVFQTPAEVESAVPPGGGMAPANAGARTIWCAEGTGMVASWLMYGSGTLTAKWIYQTGTGSRVEDTRYYYNPYTSGTIIAISEDYRYLHPRGVEWSTNRLAVLSSLRCTSGGQVGL